MVRGRQVFRVPVIHFASQADVHNFSACSTSNGTPVDHGRPMKTDRSKSMGFVG